MCWQSTWSVFWRPDHERHPHDHTVRDDRGGARGDPRGADDRRVRRREPRERGRSDAGGAVRDAGGDQLHGEGGPRADLPVADARALRGAGPGADGGEERIVVRDAVHGVDRGARRRDHGHLRARSRAHDPGGDRPRDQPSRPRPAGAHLSAEVARRGRARAHRADRGGGRPGAPGGAEPRGGDLRGDERRRHDGAGGRSRRLLRAARAEDDHDRRPDRLSPPSRQARRTRRRGEAADGVRRVRGRRLSLAARREAPRGARQGRRGRAQRRARARALGVPHRRRVPLAALRLRRAAGVGAGDDRGRGRGGAAVPRPGGSRDRPAEQAEGLPPAGGRHWTRSKRTSSSGCPPTCATTGSARRSSSTSASPRSGSSRTTRRRSRAWRATGCR